MNRYKNKAKVFMFALLTMLVLTFAVPGTITARAAVQSIYDNAGLLVSYEVQELEEKFEELSTSAGVDIIFLTVYGIDAKTQKEYLEDFVDEHCDAGDFSEDVAVMMIDMLAREITIQGYGTCEFYLNNDRIEYMLDDVYEHVADEQYFDAALEFATQADYYMHEDEGVSFEYEPGQDYGETYAGPSNYYGESSSSLGMHLIVLGVSLIIAIIVVAVMASNAGGKMTATAQTYFSAKSRGITDRRDDYVRTAVTRTKRESSSGGGRSSGGGGMSSGGRSHSGGSRSF